MKRLAGLLTAALAVAIFTALPFSLHSNEAVAQSIFVSTPSTPSVPPHALVATDANDWAYYPFSEAAGSTSFTNRVSGGLGSTPGTLTNLNIANLGAPSVCTSSQWDLGRDLDCPGGANDIYTSASTPSVYPASSELTMSGWVYYRSFFPASPNTNPFTVDVFMAVADGLTWVGVDTDGSVKCQINENTGGGTVITAASAAGVVTLNRWHHVGCVRHSGSTTHVFADGVDVTSTSSGTSDSSVTHPGSFGMSVGQNAGSYGSDRLISEIRVATTARPLSWFQSVWSSANEFVNPLTTPPNGVFAGLIVNGASGYQGAGTNGTSGYKVPTAFGGPGTTVDLRAGAGSSASSTNATAFNGALAQLIAGSGGAASGAANIGGVGGIANVKSGAGGAANSSAANGAVTGGAGAMLNLLAGAGGGAFSGSVYTATGGTGGAVNIQAGAGGAASSSGGTAINGTDGTISIGTSNGAITLGKSGGATTTVASTLTLNTALAQASGGTGTGALTCTGGQVLTSNGTSYSCTSPGTAAFVSTGYITSPASATPTITNSGGTAFTIARNSQGKYTVTMSGITTSSIIIGSTVELSSPGGMFTATPGTGSFTVTIVNGANGVTDTPFNFMVVKL